MNASVDAFHSSFHPSTHPSHEPETRMLALPRSTRRLFSAWPSAGGFRHFRHFSTTGKGRVAVIGSGNWGSVAARIVAQNARQLPDVEDEVRMWVFEEDVPVTETEIQNAWRMHFHSSASENGTTEGGIQDGENLRRFLQDGLSLQLPPSFDTSVAEDVFRELSSPAAETAEKPLVTLDSFQSWFLERSGLSGETRKLTDVINQRQENVKYLPGIRLGENVKAISDLRTAVEDANLLVFVTPHQFVKGVCEELKGVVDGKSVRAISLIKGMDVRPDGFDMISGLIERELGGMDCSVLMGANIAREIGLEEFSEATVGYRRPESGKRWQELFNTPYFHVNAVEDVTGAEVSGTLKNIVALGCGFVDGLGMGNNTKAAMIRVGLLEMLELAQRIDPKVKQETMFESCGVADLITTCYGGRNRRVAEAFVNAVGERKRTAGEFPSEMEKVWEDLEAELLKGQKLQGVLTSNELQELLRTKGWEKDFPLFRTINRIVNGLIPPQDIVRFRENP